MLRYLRFFVPLLTLLALCTIVSGCGTSTSASGLTLHIWYSTDDPVERAWSQQLAHRFESAHPNVQVRLSDYSFEDLNTKLQLALTAGNAPDLAYVTPRGPGIPTYLAAHRLLDLTADARRGGWSQRLHSGLLAQYNQPFWYMGVPRGHIVAVPTSLAAAGIMVNTRLLHRLHLSVPVSLQSFEADLARAKATGLTPIGMGNADGWLGDDWYLTLVNALVPPSSLEPEQRLDPRFSFQRPAFVRAGTILQRWANAGYFTHDFGGLDAQEGVDQFFHGTTLFQLISSSENSQIVTDQQTTHVPIGVFAFPRVHGGRVMPATGYEGWVIPAAGRHPQAAAQFIDQLLSPGTATFLAQQGQVPSQRGLPSPLSTSGAGRFVQTYIRSLASAKPGVYLDAAPVSNLNATMEANVQLLLQGYESPSFLVRSLQEVYGSHGHSRSAARIDGEF
ncbi:MAG TPA: ABC transporter substrate-binding protein [Chloroflexota bacterium]